MMEQSQMTSKIWLQIIGNKGNVSKVLTGNGNFQLK